MADAAAFLEAHPDLRRARERSASWTAIWERDALPGLEAGLYVVRGDTVGDEDELYVDVLARGSRAGGPDLLARRLFEELSPALREVVLRELRGLKPEGGHS